MRSLELISEIATSCRLALGGLFLAFRSQRNFKIHLAIAGIVLAAGVACRFSRLELTLLVMTVGMVLMGELLNTALELTLNLLEARNHPVAKAAKDVAAGAVLLGVFGSVGVGLLLFGPRWVAFLKSLSKPVS